VSASCSEIATTTRAFLVDLRGALCRSPLSVVMRWCVEGVMDLLGERDVAKRAASRDRIDALLAKQDGRLQ
jgi:hypothetical protein